MFLMNIEGATAVSSEYSKTLLLFALETQHDSMIGTELNMEVIQYALVITR